MANSSPARASAEPRPAKAAYVCDTLPTPARYVRNPAHARSRSSSPTPPQSPDDAQTSSFHVVTPEEVSTSGLATELEDAGITPGDNGPGPEPGPSRLPASPPQPPARKLCVRHQRMADEGTNLELQKSLDSIPLQDREVVSTIWSGFSHSPHHRRELILKGLLTMCCFSQLSMLSDELRHLIRIDPFSVLPREVSLKVLGYLDAISLCRAAQVNKKWLQLADDDVLWKNICEQHIGQKCHKCGWGLPMLERRRKVRAPPSPHTEDSSASNHDKRDFQSCLIDSCQRPKKRARFDSDKDSTLVDTSKSTSSERCPPARMITRPWKDVYSERLTIERNWRRGRCTVRTLNGHTDGVMCLQFSETLQHPSFPVLITGSYDKTARIWNMETGEEIRCLVGHSRAIRALQFDEAKLITGSMDTTMRVWNWRTGKCLRILDGHTGGVVCLNFDSNVLASGSVDKTIKIWNFRNGDCFTLRGHRDWVNSVQLWDSSPGAGEGGSCQTPLFDTSASSDVSTPTIEPGKMLLSASDDGSVVLWDLNLRSMVRTFSGHVGQVQSLKLIFEDSSCGNESDRPSFRDPRSIHPFGSPEFTPSPSISSPPTDHLGSSSPVLRSPSAFNPYGYHSTPNALPRAQTLNRDSLPPGRRSPSPSGSKRKHKPILISGSLDNTIRVWDVEAGKAITTLFGHIEGVWAVASDKLRVVSGSHDRTIKVWMREESRCLATLVGHRGAVTCLAMGDDKIVSGSDDGDIRIWSFAE